MDVYRLKYFYCKLLSKNFVILKHLIKYILNKHFLMDLLPSSLPVFDFDGMLSSFVGDKECIIFESFTTNAKKENTFKYISSLGLYTSAGGLWKYIR